MRTSPRPVGFRTLRSRGLCAAACLVVAAAAAGAARGEIAFEALRAERIGTSPTAVALLPVSPPVLLVADAKGLAAYRSIQGKLSATGGRAGFAIGARILAAGPLGPAAHGVVAFAIRGAARIALAPLDRRGVPAEAAEMVELPAPPRTARIAPLGPGGGAALFVAHDQGLSVIVRGDAAWERREIAAPPFAEDLAAGDLDGDGHTDVVVADAGADDLTVRHGTGEGGFAAADPIPTVRGARRVRITDFEGDGRGDLLVLGRQGIGIHRSMGGGEFRPPVMELPGVSLADADAADLDGDGFMDLAALDRFRATLRILRGDATGGFTIADSYLVGAGAEAVWLVDLDEDGRMDAITFNALSGDATLLRGRGDGTFTGIPCAPDGVASPRALAVDDFDRDGRSDIAVAGDGELALLVASGGGRFAARPVRGVGKEPRALVAGDFDNDAQPDLAVTDFGSDAVIVLTGDGHGGFAPPRPVLVGAGPTAIGTGNFGGASGVDLATANSLSASVSVLYGDGRGAFPTVVTFPAVPRPDFLIAGDTNGDGLDDLVVGGRFGDSVATLLGTDRGLEPPRTKKLGSAARPSIAEDLDRDGWMDLIALDESASVVEVLPGQASGGLGRPLRLAVGRNPHAVAPGDFDGDGYVDLAVLHRNSAIIAILFNRGQSRAAGRQGRAVRHRILTSTE